MVDKIKVMYRNVDALIASEVRAKAMSCSTYKVLSGKVKVNMINDYVEIVYFVKRYTSNAELLAVGLQTVDDLGWDSRLVGLELE